MPMGFQLPTQLQEQKLRALPKMMANQGCGDASVSKEPDLQSGGLSFIPQNLCKKLGTVMHSCNSGPEKVRAGRSLVVTGQTA